MTEKEAKQHVVLCEGFDDRSFWSGWLLHLGCTDPSERGKRTVTDAWGRPVKGKGRYLFRTPAGSDVVVHPFQGRRYSYLAKWYAAHGADDFLREIWRDEIVARQLRQRLESTGAWGVVARLAED
ncbi:MAG: hypothetical protein V3T72_14880 [Thermoanaerobaculia bacterium]